jgi:hypothetical protein
VGYNAAVRIMNFADDLHAYSRDEFSTCDWLIVPL